MKKFKMKKSLDKLSHSRKSIISILRELNSSKKNNLMQKANFNMSNLSLKHHKEGTHSKF